MILKKKRRFKPSYKKFKNINVNIQNKQKLLKFQKQKWENFLFRLLKISKTKKIKYNKYNKYNCYYKFYNQTSYYIPKFKNYFSKVFKQNVTNKQKFSLFYGYLRTKYLKKLSKYSFKSSNKITNTYNSRMFFLNFLERRLDVVLLRSFFVLSIRNARQLISHKHVLVNNKIVKDCSYLLKKSDKITFSPKTHQLIEYYAAFSPMWPLPPQFLEINYKTLQIILIEEVNNFNYYNHWINVNEIISLYKR